MSYTASAEAVTDEHGISQDFALANGSPGISMKLHIRIDRKHDSVERNCMSGSILSQDQCNSKRMIQDDW